LAKTKKASYNNVEGIFLNYEQAWNIFEQTGNVEAYLLYLQLKSEANQRRQTPEEMPGEPYLTD